MTKNLPRDARRLSVSFLSCHLTRYLFVGHSFHQPTPFLPFRDILQFFPVRTCFLPSEQVLLHGERKKEPLLLLFLFLIMRRRSCLLQHCGSARNDSSWSESPRQPRSIHGGPLLPSLHSQRQQKFGEMLAPSPGSKALFPGTNKLKPTTKPRSPSGATGRNAEKCRKMQVNAAG